MNTNPIETTKYDSALLREPDELFLAWFLIKRKPPHKLHLRSMAVAIEEFRKMSPKSREEIIECMDRLFAEFKALLEKAA